MPVSYMLEVRTQDATLKITDKQKKNIITIFFYGEVLLLFIL
jgi:hypothetical protein